MLRVDDGHRERLGGGTWHEEKKSPMQTLPGITRYDYNGAHGWLARYYPPGRTLSKLFSDSRYAWDPARSYAAACRWLAAMTTQYPLRARFKAGRGISLYPLRERNGAVFWVYSVNWTLKGTRKTTKFRCHLFPSWEEARLAAERFRAAKEQAMQQERLATLRRQWETVEVYDA